MKYEVWRDQECLGAYSEAELREGVATGKFLTTDRYRTAHSAQLMPLTRLASGISRLGPTPPRSRAWPLVGFGCGLAAFAGIVVLIFEPSYLMHISYVPLGVLITSLVTVGIAFAELGLQNSPKRKLTGLVLLLMGGIGASSTFIIPAIARVSEAGVLSQSHGRARQIITCSRLYASDHEGVLPPDLPTLISSGTIADPKIFIDPLDKTKAPYGYVYLGAGVKDTDPGSTMILHNTVPNSRGHYVVGYLDGSVKLEPLPKK